MKAVNPRTGEADYEFSADAPSEVAAVAERLRGLQRDWEAAGPEHRAATLVRFADAVDARSDAIVAALAVDTGRRMIADVELAGMTRNIRRWAECGPQLLSGLPCEAAPSTTPGLEIEPRWSAYPLVGAIAPWNFPLLLSHVDVVPALMAGSAALVKPSEVTPRFVAPLAEALAAVPELPLAYVMGGPETGEALVGAVDYVCFTGSTTTGRKVAEAAARALIPANLELGGKDPMIVTASADPGWAADIALRASVISTGQACQSIERIYVAREVAAPFLDALVTKAEAVELTYPDPAKGHIGPFIFPAQAARIAEQIESAKAAGARVLTGGEVERLGGGTWLRPTVIVDVTPDMAIMREETFGPVLPLTVFEDIEQAIALANDSTYGLSGTVLAGSMDEAAAIGARLEVGAVSLQDGALTTACNDAANESRRTSGLGPSRMGDEGFLRFLRRQSLIRQTGPAATIDMFREDAAR